MPQTIEIEIHDVSRGGSGVGKTKEGQAVFVPFTAPGDLVRVELFKAKKNYAQGKLVEVLRPSPVRVTPKCPVFGTCGGCEWQHLNYETQWQTKVKGTLQALGRAGVVFSGTAEEFPATHQWNYRNRIQLRGQGENIGFRKRESTELVAIDHCDIARKELNAAIPQLRTEGKKFDREYKLEIEVNESGKVESSWNASHAALGFRQINDEQNTALKKWVAANITKNRELLDLYGGAGNLSINLQEEMTNILCVDVSAPTERSTKKMIFRKFAVETWLAKQLLFPTPQQPRSAILDPPRDGVGMNFKLIEEELSRISVRELILVGCDVDSWVRDCIGFQKQGWKLEKVALFDLFPQTHHLESVAKWVK